MRSATANGITIINFGMGSPNAATIMDCLSAITQGLSIPGQMWRFEKEK